MTDKPKSRARKPKHQKVLIITLSVSLLLVIVAIIFLVIIKNESKEEVSSDQPTEKVDEEKTELSENPEPTEETEPISNPIPAGGNCTTAYGKLMLINANYTVDNTFIANRKTELVDLTATYGVKEANYWNGIPLLDAEAATHLNDMLTAYATENQGHSLSTMSCFRSIGTSCGRLCAATGTSDHHTGYVCDLIDTSYGTTLDTDYLDSHPDWKWLKENSYKYGFIDRYPSEWAGSSMNEPLNVDSNGTTGYYETWHYRYVGIPAAYDIATGKYNNGTYDSLEHYLKSIGLIKNLTSGNCN